MNENTLDLIREKKESYDKMSKICDDILSGTPIAKACRNNNMSTNNFRRKVLYSTEPSMKISHSREELDRLSLGLLTPEEKLFKDVLCIDNYFCIDKPDDFDETIESVLSEVCSKDWYEVIKLRYWEDMTFEQIGQIKSCSKIAISEKIHSVLDCMRKQPYARKLIYGNREYEEYVKKVQRCNYIDAMISNLDAINKLDAEYKPILDKLKEHYASSISNIPIEDIGISSRIYRPLKWHGIFTVAEVLKKSDDYLLKNVRGFGVGALEELNQALREWGFRKEV